MIKKSKNASTIKIKNPLLTNLKNIPNGHTAESLTSIAVAKDVQTSGVEGPDPEELAPVTEDHSHFIEDKESAREKLIPVVAGEAAPSPEESLAEDDIIVTEPDLVFTGVQVSEDADEAVSEESAPQDHFTAAPQESSEEENVPAEAAFAEASPDETAGEVDPAVVVESQSPQQHYEDTPAPEAPIPVILLEVSDDEALEENVEEEPLLLVPDDNTEVEEKLLPLTPEEEKSEAVEAGQGELEAGEPAPHESAQEDPDVIVPLDPAELEPDQEEQEETVPLILSERKEEEAFEPVVVEENAKEDPVTHEEPLPSSPEEEEPVVLDELDGQEEVDAGETTPEMPAVIVFVGPTSEEPALEDPILIIHLEDLEEYAAENNTEEVVQSDPLTQEAVLEEDTTPQENEAGDRDAEILVTSVAGTTSGTIEEVLDPGEEVPAAATEVHDALEPVTTPAPAVTDEQAETVPASVESGGGTVETHSEDFKAELVLTEEEPGGENPTLSHF